VYADLDVEALRPMDELLRGGRPVLAFLSATWWLRHNIPNAWMASPPGHEFWRVRLLRLCICTQTVILNTGPLVALCAVRAQARSDRSTMLPVLSPLNTDQCQSRSCYE
jgi:mannosyltransferase OCH1-like enzyme